MQVIGATFRAFHWPGTSDDIYDPLANIAAALNYGEHGRGFGSGPGQIGSGHGYATGGWVNEPVYGIGASGQSYTFGERGSELVVPGDDLRSLGSKLDRLIAVTAAVPAATGRHVGGAINGAADDAAFRKHYPRAR
jgi:SLT domain-containing protein